jgi:hypothetical protein
MGRLCFLALLLCLDWYAETPLSPAHSGTTSATVWQQNKQQIADAIRHLIQRSPVGPNDLIARSPVVDGKDWQPATVGADLRVSVLMSLQP